MFGMTNNSDKIMRKYCRSELEGDITAETVTAFVSSNSLPLVSIIIIIIIIVILVIKIVVLIHHHHHHHHHHHFMFKVVEFNTDTAKAIFQGSYNNHLLMFLSKEVAIIIIIIIMKIMIVKHYSDFILKDAKFEYVLHDARKVGPAFKEEDSQESDVMLASLFCFSSPK